MSSTSAYPCIAEGYGVFITPDGGQIFEYEEIDGVKQYVQHCKTLNVQACAILEFCTGLNTVKDIVNMCEKKFEDAPPDLSTHVQTFLDDAFQKGYIQYSDTKGLKGLIKGTVDYYIPSQVLFETTANCNLQCEHCLLSAGAPLEDELSTAQIISVLERFFAMGVANMDISGGELLTREGWEILADFCKNKFTLGILTNGTLITDKIADTLVQYDRVNISLYGKDAQTHDTVTGVPGSFDHVLQGVTRLTEKGINVRASVLMLPFNVHQLEDIVKLAVSLGCKRVQVGIICSVGRAQAKNWELSKEERTYLGEKMNNLKRKYKDIEIQWEEEPSEKKEHKCGAGFTRWVIAANGDVYPCATIRMPMGNVIKDGVIPICESPAVKFLQELLTPHEALCGDCQYLYVCRECHGQAFAHFFKVDNCSWANQFENAPPYFKDVIEKKKKK